MKLVYSTKRCNETEVVHRFDVLGDFLPSDLDVLNKSLQFFFNQLLLSFLHLHLISYFIILSPTHSPFFYILYYLTHLSSIVANPSPPNCTCTCILSFLFLDSSPSPSSVSSSNFGFNSVTAPDFDSSSDPTYALIPDCGPKSKYGFGCCVT